MSSLTQQIAAARKHIKNSLDSVRTFKLCVVLVRFKWELPSLSLLINKLKTFQVDNLSSGLSAAEEMALMKKLGALEVENKELKKGEEWLV